MLLKGLINIEKKKIFIQNKNFNLNYLRKINLIKVLVIAHHYPVKDLQLERFQQGVCR